MPTPSARQAKIEDLPAILDLLADDPLGQGREDVGPPPHPDYLEAFKAIRDDPNQFLAVFVSDNEIVGCLQLSFIPGLSRRGAWRGQIESVRVSATMRGAGLGRKMFNWAIDTCRQRGCRLVQLTSDKSRKDALAFYRSLGFTASHEGFKLDLSG
ncbi:MAG: GNAT family N-acetyltransferase [Alphaproteobacteria bacterium]|jgi:ribosomal protein S18 acetylase RimI-like enzyme|nr:GNAT family N-acetyltransferase [Alphaproteobacteria bacterium]